MFILKVTFSAKIFICNYSTYIQSLVSREWFVFVLWREQVKQFEVHLKYNYITCFYEVKKDNLINLLSLFHQSSSADLESKLAQTHVALTGPMRQQELQLMMTDLEFFSHLFFRNSLALSLSLVVI